MIANCGARRGSLRCESPHVVDSGVIIVADRDGAAASFWPPYPDDRPAVFEPADHTDADPGGRNTRPRCPTGLAVVFAYFGPLAIAGMLVPMGTAVPLPAEVAVLAAVVGAIGWTARAGAGLLAVVSCWLCLNGFRENDAGTLALHPRVDVPAVAALAGVWLVTWAVQTRYRRGRHTQMRPTRPPTTACHRPVRG
jgi:hypothetical protein